ncbi:MAG: hypothetical protein HUK21_04370, partial [Fibrobacteraceae bacterium]|nr:hypothetical protein [Fibrobacteraceae bacterium]
MGIADITHKNTNEYDYADRLINVLGDSPGSYSFDEIGRMKTKNENGTSIDYIYRSGTYRPSEFSITNYGSSGKYATETTDFLRYDASGNAWYDKNSNVLYKNNVNGLPVRAYKFTSIPENVTLNEVNSGTLDKYNPVMVVDFAYDESGSRVWYSVDDRENGRRYTHVSIPGVGVYTSEELYAADVGTKAASASPVFTLARMDLVAGGYRVPRGSESIAYFPVTDA